MLRAIEHVRYPPSVRVSDKAGAESTRKQQHTNRAPTDLTRRKRHRTANTPGCKARLLAFRGQVLTGSDPEPKTPECRAPDIAPVKATPQSGAAKRPALTGATGAHA